MYQSLLIIPYHSGTTYKEIIIKQYDLINNNYHYCDFGVSFETFMEDMTR